MHPEVEELIKKKGWKPSQAAVFEDIKRAFPDMSLNDAMNLVLQYYFPQKEIRKNGAIIEHRLTDVRTGKERVLTLEEMRKARVIVQKNKLGNIEYQYDAEDRLFDKAVDAKVKQILEERLGPEIKEMLKSLISDVRDAHPAKAAPRTPGKRGRRKKEFEDYLRDDAPENLMPVLEKMLDGKTGKEAFSIILAIQDEYLTGEPEDKCVCRRFPSIAPNSYGDAKNRHYGRNKYIDNRTPIDEWKLLRIRNEIRMRLDLNQ